MERQFEIREGENGLERAMDILDMILLFHDDITDDEVEGVAHYLFPDVRNTALGLLELPSSRDLEVLFFKRVIKVLREATHAQKQGKKVVFVPFTFPPEIIYSFESLFPVCTEIVGGLIVNICSGQGERFWDFAMGMGLPDSLCSANTIAVAGLCYGPGLKPDAIVSNSPGSCNPNAKMHAFASDYLDIPQFILEKPVDESSRGRELYYQYLLALIKDLEEFSGEKLSVDRLRETMERSYKAVELYNEFWELKKIKPCPVPNIFNMTLLVLRSQLWGRDEAVEILQRMVDISKERLSKGEFTAPEEIARVYMNYIYFLFDFYNFFTWMEKRGVTILGDVLGIHFFPPMDFSSKESMLRGLADIAFDYPMTRQMGANSISVKWLEDIAYAVQDLGADACVYCGHHACKHTSGTIAYFRRELMKRLGVPTLVLMGDAFDKRHLPSTMMQEEMTVFVDQLISKKKAPRRRRRTSQQRSS